MELVKKKDISRRDFLRAFAGLGIGAVVGGAISAPSSKIVNDTVGNITGQPTGNASVADKINRSCAENLDSENCESDYTHSASFVIKATVMAPILEELSFRAIPSATIDLADNDKNKDVPVLKTTLVGKESYKLTRKELFYGLASSAIFAYTHNLYTKQNEAGEDVVVFSLNTIPAAQFTTGMIFWYLTRKYGIGSSILAHSAHNTVSIMFS